VINAAKRNVSQKAIKIEEVNLNLITNVLNNRQKYHQPKAQQRKTEKYIAWGFVIRIFH